jgi:hypothetical protein
VLSFIARALAWESSWKFVWIEEVVVEGPLNVDSSFHDCRTEVFVGSCNHVDFVFFDGFDFPEGCLT